MVNSGPFDSEGARMPPPTTDRCKPAADSTSSGSGEGAHSPSHPPQPPPPDTALPGLRDAVGPTPTQTEFTTATADSSTPSDTLCCSLPLDKLQPPGDDTGGGGGDTAKPKQSPPPRKLLCLYCERSFASPNLRQKHVERCHSSKQSRRASTRRPHNTQQLTTTPCIYCDRLTAAEHTLRQLFEHLALSHAGRYFACVPCEDRFLTASALAEHNAGLHAAPAPGSGSASKQITRHVSVLLEKDVTIAAAVAAFKQDTLPPNLPVHTLAAATAARSSPVSSSSSASSSRCADDKCAVDSDLSESSSRVKVKKELVQQDDVSSEQKPPKEGFDKASPDKIKKETPTTKTTRSKVKASDQQSEQESPSPASSPITATDSKKKEQNLRQLRSKKMTVKASKISQKRMSKRLQAKISESQKKRRTRAGDKAAGKPEQVGSGQKLGEKAAKTGAACQNPYPEFDSFYRVKKITDHSIDNLKISSLKFDDVFDKAFFNRIQCNIQENLLHHIDGKLFKNEESESRISNFEKISSVAQEAPNASAESYGCELSLNAVTPVASLLTSAHFGEDLESQIEYGSKPSKKKLGSSRQDEVHYKYFTRRKYQASIMEQKENRDLSKLDMWTQLVIKSRQQKMADDKKTAKEMLEYTSGLEYKTRLKREELNRILDRRGPFEDLKEEATKKAALDKLNSDSDDRVSEEAFTDVQEILNELLANVFDIVNADSTDETSVGYGASTGDGSTSVQRCGSAPSYGATGTQAMQKYYGAPLTSFTLQKSASSTSCSSLATGEERIELPSYLKLRRSSSLPSEGEIDRSDRIALICSSQETEYDEVPSRSVRGKNEMVELTGEWARSRIYVCAACGQKVANMRRLLEHKNAHHQYVWTQHYEFVGNQSELYRHLSIPGLGKVGAVEGGVSKGRAWRRSEARVCSKCGRRCNALADLHRHVLECGGDWTWMLARKKCKYRPFGTKSRRKRRGLVKRIRVQKSDNGAERKYKKRYDGPRQRPSDADTIQRMLANLPAKRATRKVMSLKDGYQRNHQPHISIMPQNKMKCGKIIVRNTSNIRPNPSLANASKDCSASSNKTNSNPSVSSATKSQNANHRNDRRTLKNLNKVLASRILDTNASLLVKRKLKTLSNRRTTRRDISKTDKASPESTKKESPKAEDKGSKSTVKKTPPKSSKAKADSGDGKEDSKAKKNSKADKSDKVSDTATSDTGTKKSNKVLPNKLSLKSFFPVKKKKAAAPSDQKPPKAAKASSAVSESTSNDKETTPDETKTIKDKRNGKPIKKAKNQSFGSLVRSLSLRKRKLLRMEEKKTDDKSEDTSVKTSVEEEQTNKKRKLKQTIKKVVEKVKRVKTAKAGEASRTKSDSSRLETGDNKKPTGPFLEAGNVEESPPIEKIVIPSTLEKSESTADISVLAPIVISVSAASEEPQTSKTIFNLQSNNEKNLQAKGELNFDSQNRQPDTTISQSLSPNTITANAPVNTPGSCPVSPNMKGKIRRPAKRLNDCIAMLTNKLQQQQQHQQPTSTNIFNLRSPSSHSQPNLFHSIPEPKPVQEECVALDLSMKNKPKEPDCDMLRIPTSSQCMPKSSYNSIDMIIQEVVENKLAKPPPYPFLREPLKVPSKHNMAKKWNSIDDIIQSVVENKCGPKHDQPLRRTASMTCETSLNETIESVATGKYLEEANARPTTSDINLSIKDIVKVPNVPKPNKNRKSVSLTPLLQPPTPLDICSLIAGVSLPPLPPNLIVTLSDPVKDIVSVPLPVNFNILNIPLASVIAPVLNAQVIAKNVKKSDEKPAKSRAKKILKSKIMSKSDGPNEIQDSMDNSSNLFSKVKTYLETDMDNIMNLKEVNNVVNDVPTTVTESLLPTLEAKQTNFSQIIPLLVEENEPIQLENKVVTSDPKPIDAAKVSVEKALKSDSEDELPLAALKPDKKLDSLQESTEKSIENITITDLLNSSRSDNISEVIKAESFNHTSNQIFDKRLLKKSLKKRNRPGVNMRPVFKIKAFRKPLRKPSVDAIMASIERVIKGVDENEEVSSTDEEGLTEVTLEEPNLERVPVVVSESNPIIDVQALTDKEKENIPDQPSDATGTDITCDQTTVKEEPSETVTEKTEIVENKLTELVSNIPQPEQKVAPKRSKKRKPLGVIRTRVPSSKRRAAKKKKQLSKSTADVSVETKMEPMCIETEQQSDHPCDDAEMQEMHQPLCDISKETEEKVMPHESNECANMSDVTPSNLDTLNHSSELSDTVDKIPTSKQSKQKKQKKSTPLSDSPKLDDSVEHGTDASKVSEIDSIALDTDLNQSPSERTAIEEEEEITTRTKSRRKCTLISKSLSPQNKSDKNANSKISKVKSAYELSDVDSLIPEPTEAEPVELTNIDLESNKNIIAKSNMKVTENIKVSSRRKSKARASKKRVASSDKTSIVSNIIADNNVDIDSSVENVSAICVNLEKEYKKQESSINIEGQTISLDENQTSTATTFSGVVDIPKQAVISDHMEKISEPNKDEEECKIESSKPELRERTLNKVMPDSYAKNTKTINECSSTVASNLLTNVGHITETIEKSIKPQHKKRTLDKVLNYLLASTTHLDPPKMEVLAKDESALTTDGDDKCAKPDGSKEKPCEKFDTNSDTKALETKGSVNIDNEDNISIEPNIVLTNEEVDPKTEKSVRCQSKKRTPVKAQTGLDLICPSSNVIKESAKIDISVDTLLLGSSEKLVKRHSRKRTPSKINTSSDTKNIEFAEIDSATGESNVLTLSDNAGCSVVDCVPEINSTSSSTESNQAIAKPVKRSSKKKTPQKSKNKKLNITENIVKVDAVSDSTNVDIPTNTPLDADISQDDNIINLQIETRVPQIQEDLSKDILEKDNTFKPTVQNDKMNETFAQNLPNDSRQSVKRQSRKRTPHKLKTDTVANSIDVEDTVKATVLGASKEDKVAEGDNVLTDVIEKDEKPQTIAKSRRSRSKKITPPVPQPEYDNSKVTTDTTANDRSDCHRINILGSTLSKPVDATENKTPMEVIVTENTVNVVQTDLDIKPSDAVTNDLIPHTSENKQASVISKRSAKNRSRKRTPHKKHVDIAENVADASKDAVQTDEPDVLASDTKAKECSETKASDVPETSDVIVEPAKADAIDTTDIVDGKTLSTQVTKGNKKSKRLRSKKRTSQTLKTEEDVVAGNSVNEISLDTSDVNVLINDTMQTIGTETEKSTKRRSRRMTPEKRQVHLDYSDLDIAADASETNVNDSSKVDVLSDLSSTKETVKNTENAPKPQAKKTAKIESESQVLSQSLTENVETGEKPMVLDDGQSIAMDVSEDNERSVEPQTASSETSITLETELSCETIVLPADIQEPKKKTKSKSKKKSSKKKVATGKTELKTEKITDIVSDTSTIKGSAATEVREEKMIVTNLTRDMLEETEQLGNESSVELMLLEKDSETVTAVPEEFAVKTTDTNRSKSKKCTSKKKATQSSKVIKESTTKTIVVPDVISEVEDAGVSSDTCVEVNIFDDANQVIENRTRRRIPVRRLIDEISSALDVTVNRKAHIDKTGDNNVEVEKRTRLTRQTVSDKLALLDGNDEEVKVSNVSLQSPNVDDRLSKAEKSDEIAPKNKSKRSIIQPNAICENEPQNDNDILDAVKSDFKEDNTAKSKSKKSAALQKPFTASEPNLICKLPLISCEDGKFSESIYNEDICARTRTKKRSLELSEKVPVSIDPPVEASKAETPLEIAQESQLVEISKEDSNNKNDSMQTEDCFVEDKSDLELSGDVEEVNVQISHEDMKVKKSVKKSKNDKKAAKKKKDASIKKNKVQAQDVENAFSSASKPDNDSPTADDLVVAPGDKDKPVKAQKITLKPPTLNFLLPPMQFTSVFTTTPGSCFGGFSFSKPASDPIELGKESPSTPQQPDSIKFGSITETTLTSDLTHTATKIINDSTIKKLSKDSSPCAEDGSSVTVSDDDPLKQVDVSSRADDAPQSADVVEELKAPKITLNLKEVLSKKSSSKKKKSKKVSKIKTSTPDNSFSENSLADSTPIELTQLDVSNVQPLVAGEESVGNKVIEDEGSRKVKKSIEPDEQVISKPSRKELSKATQEETAVLPHEFERKTTRSRRDVLTGNDKVLCVGNSLTSLEKSGKVVDDILLPSNSPSLEKDTETANTSCDSETNNSKSIDVTKQQQLSEVFSETSSIDGEISISDKALEKISEEVTKVQSSRKTSRTFTKRSASTKKTKTTRTASLDTLTKLIHDSIEKLGEGQLDSASEQKELENIVKRSMSFSSTSSANNNEQNNTEIGSSIDSGVKHKSPKRKSRKPTKSTVLSEEIIYVSKQSEATVSYSKSEEKLPMSCIESDNKPSKTTPAFRDEFALLAELSGENMEELETIHTCDSTAQNLGDKLTFEKSDDNSNEDDVEQQEKAELALDRKAKEKVKTSKKDSSVKEINENSCEVVEPSESAVLVTERKSGALAQVKRKSKKVSQNKRLVESQSLELPNENDKTDSFSESVYTFSEDDLGVTVKKQKKNKKTNKESIKNTTDLAVDSELMNAKDISLCKTTNESSDSTMKIKLKKTHNKKLSLVIKPNDDHTRKFDESIEQVNYVSSTVIENEPMSPPKICLKITKDPIHNLVTVESNIKEPPSKDMSRTDTRFELSPPKLILKNLDQKYLENKDVVPKVSDSKMKSQSTRKHSTKSQITNISSENDESSASEMIVDTSLTQPKKGWGLGRFLSEPSTDDTSEADTADVFAKPKIKRKTKTQAKNRPTQKNLSESNRHADNNSDTSPQLSAEDNALTTFDSGDSERTMPVLLPVYDEPEIISSDPSADEIYETDIKNDHMRQRSSRKAKTIANSIIQKDILFDKQTPITDIDSLQSGSVDAPVQSQMEIENVIKVRGVSSETKKVNTFLTHQSDLSTDETSESDSGLFVKPKPKKKFKSKTSRKKSTNKSTSSMDIDNLDGASTQSSVETEEIAIDRPPVLENMSSMDVTDASEDTSGRDSNLSRSLQSDTSTDEVSETEMRPIFIKPPGKKKSKVSVKKKSKKKTAEHAKLPKIDIGHTLDSETNDNVTAQIAEDIDVATNKPKLLIAEPKLVVPDTHGNEHSDSNLLFSRKTPDKHKQVDLDETEKTSANITDTIASNYDVNKSQEPPLHLSSIANTTIILDDEIDHHNLPKPQIKPNEPENTKKDTTPEHRNKRSKSGSKKESDASMDLQSLEDTTELDMLGVLGSRRRSGRVLQKDVNTVNDRSQSLELDLPGEDDLSDYTVGSRGKRKSKIAAEQRLQQLKAAENVPLDEDDEEDEENKQDMTKKKMSEKSRHEKSVNDENINKGLKDEDEFKKKSLEVDQSVETGIEKSLYSNVPEDTENLSIPKKLSVSIKKSSITSTIASDDFGSKVSLESRKDEEPVIAPSDDAKKVSPNKGVMVERIELYSKANDIESSCIDDKKPVSKPSNSLCQSTTDDLYNYKTPSSNNVENLSLAEKVAMAIRESNKKLFAETSDTEAGSQKVNDEPKSTDDRLPQTVEVLDNKCDTSALLDVSKSLIEETTSRSKRKSKLAANRRLQQLNYLDNDDSDECLNKSVPVMHILNKDHNANKADKNSSLKEMPQNEKKELADITDKEPFSKDITVFHNKNVEADSKDTNTLECLSNQQAVEDSYKVDCKPSKYSSIICLQKSKSLGDLVQFSDEEDQEKEYLLNAKTITESPIVEDHIDRSCSAENLTDNCSENNLDDLFIKPKMKRKATSSASKRRSKKIDLDKDVQNLSESKQSLEPEDGSQPDAIENNLDSVQDDLVEMEIMKLKIKNKSKTAKNKKWDVDAFSKSATSNGRRTHRKAKTKALEHILDEALSELSASNQNSDLLSRKKSESDCLPFEPEENLIRLENEARMANNNIEMASIEAEVDSTYEEDSLHSINFEESAQFDDPQNNEISDDDMPFEEDISEPDVSSNMGLDVDMQVTSPIAKPALRTRNRSKSITADKPDLDEIIEGSQEVRRSKRATKKIGSYNENEIANALIEAPLETIKKDKKKENQTVEPLEQDMKLDPVPMVLEDIPKPGIIIENPPHLSSLQPTGCFPDQNKKGKDDKVQSKLNSDELFDLLKKSTNDNPDFQKSHNSYVPNFDEISDFSSDSNNFDNVFEDILEIEDNLDESGKENRSDDLDEDIFEFSRSSQYRTDRTSDSTTIHVSQPPAMTNDVSIPSIDVSGDKQIIHDDTLKDTDKTSVINFDVLKEVAETSIINSVENQETSEKARSESNRDELDNANTSLISAELSESSTDKFNSKSKNSSKKSRGSRNLANLFCDICNKSFRRSDNLVKHKRTLTHISKLSELEAQEAMKKAPEIGDDNQQPTEEKNDSNISIISSGLPEDITAEDMNPEDNTFNVDNSSFQSENNAFSQEDNAFPQEHTALENSKSHDDENISISNILSVDKPDLPINDSSLITTNFAVDTENRSLKLADIINDVLNKPVLERSNGNNFSDIILQNSSDVQPEYRRYKSLGERKSFESDPAENVPSNLNIDPPSFLEISDNTERVEKQITLLQNIIEKNGTSLNYTEEISVSSNQSVLDSARDSPCLSVGSSRQEDSNNVTFSNSNKMAANDDSFIKPSHYEEISEDSAQHRGYDEQKARKVLNRDEELFLECCSLWKSGSEVSNYSKKSHKLSVANSQEMKVAEEPEWMEDKQLAQKHVYEDNYSDNSRIPTPLGDSYNDEMSNSNTISSNWNANKKEEIEANNRAVLQGDVVQVDGDRSFVFQEDSSSAKSEGKASRFAALSNAFKTISEKVVDKFKSRTDKEKEILPDLCIDKDNEEAIENDGKKFVTKGAKKEFEGLKVSIPTEELNLSEVLNCSPTAKVQDNKLDKPEPAQEQQKEEKVGKEDFVTPNVTAPKVVKKSKFSKAKLQHGNKFGFKMTKKKTPTKSLKRKKQAIPRKSDGSKIVDIYDFEETQDNSDVFTKPDFRSFRCKKTEDAGKVKDTSAESDNDSHGFEAKSVSSVSSMSSIPPKKAKTQPVTKKKCMIMGRIFKNAVKSKVEEDIRDIPTIDNVELVNNYVMNCPEVPVEEKVVDKEPSEICENVANTETEMLPPPCKEPLQDKNKVDTKLVSKKKNTKLMKSRKRNRANSDSTDDEFSLNKNTKKRTNRKNPKAEDNIINLEQELKECIGVASRKSQRKCTSGKQNVLVEYWSSDDSSFEAMLESQRIIPSEEREPVREPERPIEEVPPPDIPVPVEPELMEVEKPAETPTEMAEPVNEPPQVLPEVLPEPPKETQTAPRQQKPKKSKSTDKKLVKKPRVDVEFRKAEGSAETLAASRRKRAAADPLYHWSSSSEDESQDLIEVKPIRDELDDDEDRPVQHGWIVGDSPKKLVTMLAQAKGKKVDADCVKEQGKKRTANTNS